MFITWDDLITPRHQLPHIVIRFPFVNVIKGLVMHQCTKLIVLLNTFVSLYLERQGMVRFPLMVEYESNRQMVMTLDNEALMTKTVLVGISFTETVKVERSVRQK